MRSGTSFFNKTIYRKTVNRFWPLWAVNLVVWLFVLPMNGLFTLLDAIRMEVDYFTSFARNVGDYIGEIGLPFALFAGLVVAMAVCSQMYNNRSANFIGALPVRREAQFVSSYLAGLTMLIGPNVLVFLLTLAVETAAGLVMWTPLLVWLGALCAMEFFFYTFAVCLGQFTGHILAVPVYYAVFNAIVLVGYWLLEWVFSAFYFGFVSFDVGLSVAYACTPVATFGEVRLREDLINDIYVFELLNGHVLVVYAVVAAVLAVCALLLHRRRHLETAGDAVAVRAMRPVFKYGVSVCAGLCFGYLTTAMFDMGIVGFMVAIVIWGIVGYFVAQMILDKSFRVFRKWKGAVGVTAVFLLLFAVIGFDLTGYETRVPDVEDVESVYVFGLEGYPYDSGAYLSGEAFDDPAVIADVIALHEAIVEYGAEGEAQEGLMLEFRVDYKLKSGSTVRRSYYIRAEDTLFDMAQKIRDHDEVRRSAYELEYVEDYVAAGAWLDYVTLWENGNGVSESGIYAEMLWEAVMEDFEAGRIGVHVMDHDQWFGAGNEPDPLLIEFEWVKKNVSLDGYDGYTAYHQEFAVLDQSSSTWRVLEALWADGILGDPGKIEGDSSAGFVPE